MMFYFFLYLQKRTHFPDSAFRGSTRQKTYLKKTNSPLPGDGFAGYSGESHEVLSCL